MREVDVNKKTATKLFVVALAMFGFGYGLAPLYDIFCEVTGLNGKTGRIAEETIKPVENSMDRVIKVQFVTNVATGLPWEFKPLSRTMEVVPGKLMTAEFEATNKSSRSLVGSAVPSVSPSLASKYFNKTDCFCFVRQSLKPGETKLMPVAFIVDSKIPPTVDVLTLSYTFFKAKYDSDDDNV